MELIRMDPRTMFSIVLFLSFTSATVLARLLRDSSELLSVPPSALLSDIENKTVTVNQIADHTTAIILSVLILVVVVLCFRNKCCVNASPSVPSENEQSNPENPEACQTYSVKVLTAATKNFSNLVGKGASGDVYRADLPGNIIGAVKRLREIDCNLFKKKLSVLLQLPRHPNLVNLIGICSERDDQMIVFEYVGNGTLFSRLHENQDVAGPLCWASRKKIARQVAEALRHLHEQANPPIIHRDVKSKNVLLQNDSYAKLTDFGIAKFGPKDNGSTYTTPCGTPGYMDPQDVIECRCSAKSDVYSFGVLLLELITGSKALIGTEALVNRTREHRLSTSTKRIMKIVHESLPDRNNRNELLEMIRIANHCLESNRGDRPSMAEVVNMMDRIRNA